MRAIFTFLLAIFSISLFAQQFQQFLPTNSQRKFIPHVLEQLPNGGVFLGGQDNVFYTSNGVSTNVLHTDGFLFKSTNGGNSWAQRFQTNTDVTVDGDVIGITEFYPGKLVSLVKQQSGFKLFNSSNVGETWQMISIGLPYTNFIPTTVLGFAQELYLGGHYYNYVSIQKLSKYATQWDSLYLEELPFHLTFVDSKMFSLLSNNALYYAYTLLNDSTEEYQSRILMSEDYGSSWSYMNTEYPGRLYDMEFLSDSVMFLCGSAGVYYKTSVGTSWDKVDGLPAAYVCHSMDVTSNGTIYVAGFAVDDSSFQASVWRSTNIDLGWNKIFQKTCSPTFIDDKACFLIDIRDNLNGLLCFPNNYFYRFTDYTGIAGKPAQTEIQVYPNPATDVLQIHLPKFVAGSIELINLAGEQVYTQQIYNPNIELDVSAFATGVYILNYQSYDGVFTGSTKVVVE